MVVISSFSPPTDGIKHEQPFTTVFVSERDLGKGTLFITESRLSWVNSRSGEGFSLEYPHIALHAVSRDLQAHPHECLYIMVDTKLDEPAYYDQDDGEEESDPGMTEIRFIPDDKGMLDAMFHAMSECQALHPDPQDSFSDDIYEDADDDDEGDYHLGSGDAPLIVNASGFTQTTNGVNMEDEPMEMEAGQFEDAEGEPDY